MPLPGTLTPPHTHTTPLLLLTMLLLFLTALLLLFLTTTPTPLLPTQTTRHCPRPSGPAGACVIFGVG